MPTVLTICGSVISCAAFVGGVALATESFLVSILASLTIAGPALIISNILVRNFQDQRTDSRLVPMIVIAAHLLAEAVETASDAARLIGDAKTFSKPSLGEIRGVPGLLGLVLVVASLNDAERQLRAAIEVPRVDKPSSLKLDDRKLVFPAFSVISKLIEQADRGFAMPWAVVSSSIAQNWADQCGVDFVYGMHLGDNCLVERRVGVPVIVQWSEFAIASETTGVGSISYLRCVEDCLRHAKAVAAAILKDGPSRLTVQASKALSGDQAALLQDILKND
ncbi:hypothetical protein CH251_09605 [Rhodococcus sp. 06-462-5]|nr:hypothetical protein CH251_09605 [Rhodococcus sp. 06-462-5]